MKKIIYILLIIITGSLGIASRPAMAIPTLQLDIEGGSYDTTTETIVASGNPFTLYALLIPNSKNTLSDWYYISAAVVPKTGPADVSLGSFSITGDILTPLPGDANNTILVTEEMVYGVPPLETVSSLQGWDKGDLPKHGIYSTYFAEFGFQFSSSNKATPYNTQDDTGAGPAPNSSGSMYYAAFTINTELLDPDYVIHFDLYNKKLRDCTVGADCDITQFAPFSHDAESGKVPEPATLLLLGMGLVGLSLFGRRKNHRA